ncbi:MAG: M28 family peptidase [Bacteroidetes bacterium]|nr:M28 family peptidase [Bacteroidota bacterium]
MISRSLLSACVVLFFSIAAFGAPPKKINTGNAEAITEAQLKDYLSFLASDEFEGRDTPSRGLNIAAKFIATELSRWGWKPGGDSGSYFQNIELDQLRIIPSETTVRVDSLSFAFGDDFILSPVEEKLSGNLVYVQSGFFIKSKNLNPYEGIDIQGKFIIVLGGFPQGIGFADFKGRRGEDWDFPSGYAKAHGALGVITIPSKQQFSGWERLKANATVKGTVRVAKFENNESQNSIPVITASERLIKEIFLGEIPDTISMTNSRQAESVRPFALSSKKIFSLSSAVSHEKIITQNVVGILEGKGKKLKDEYVAFGAHYDHVGIGNPVHGDSIYNGADDDGSGTAALLSMAEAFAKGAKPERSLLFVWHCGEEKGLWGSKYFTNYPTVPLSNIITQLNIDMIGRSIADTDTTNNNMTKNNEVFVIGSKMMSSELGAFSEKINNEYLHLSFNYKFDDPNDSQRLFYRSDHYNYAKKGIPIIFYFDGLHEDYHRPSDEVEKIDFNKLCKVTRTVFVTGWNLANMPKKPAVDTPLKEQSTED